jgi:hypothetical protein
VTSLLLLIPATAAVLLLVWRLFSPGINGLVTQAVRQGDAAPLLRGIEARAEAMRPVAYNQAIRRLWNLYERELARDLIRELAAAHAETKIAQFWLKELLTSEPRLAQALSSEFIARYYRPEVAAQCGAVG